MHAELSQQCTVWVKRISSKYNTYQIVPGPQCSDNFLVERTVHNRSVTKYLQKMKLMSMCGRCCITPSKYSVQHLKPWGEITQLACKEIHYSKKLLNYIRWRASWLWTTCFARTIYIHDIFRQSTSMHILTFKCWAISHSCISMKNAVVLKFYILLDLTASLDVATKKEHNTPAPCLFDLVWAGSEKQTLVIHDALNVHCATDSFLDIHLIFLMTLPLLTSNQHNIPYSHVWVQNAAVSETVTWNDPFL